MNDIPEDVLVYVKRAIRHKATIQVENMAIQELRRIAAIELQVPPTEFNALVKHYLSANAC